MSDHELSIVLAGNLVIFITITRPNIAVGNGFPEIVIIVTYFEANPIQIPILILDLYQLVHAENGIGKIGEPDNACFSVVAHIRRGG